MTIRNPEWIGRMALQFEDAPTEEILSWAWERLGPDVAVGTAFGASGMVLLHIRHQVAPDMPVFFVDTSFQFPETLELKARVESLYNMKIEVLEPEISIEEQDVEHGLELYNRDPDQCCWIRKVEPLQRKLRGLDGWVSSLRRDQSKSREAIEIMELHMASGSGRRLVKVNPMANWTRKQIWDYILEHELPYNPLMDQGYTSVGCWPCTRSVGSDAGEREGRWAGTDKTECGIHTFLGTSASSANEIADREAEVHEAVE